MEDQLSEHFTLSELTRSQTALRLGIDNYPPEEVINNLRTLCQKILEPARSILARPLHIDSGFRCPALNASVGGAKTSAHMTGRAADIIPISIDLVLAFEKLRHSQLPYDQIIIECGAWIHIGMAVQGADPRREAMTASGIPGHWTYVPVKG